MEGYVSRLSRVTPHKCGRAMAPVRRKIEAWRGRLPAMVIGVVVGVVILVGGFAYILGRDSNRTGTLTLFHDNKKVAEIDIKQGSVTIDKLLDNLFKDEEQEKMFRALVREMKQYYQLRDPALIVGIATLSIDEPNARGLRQLYYEGKGPFAPLEFPVRVSVPNESVIAVGQAAVCPQEDLFRKELLVLGPENRSMVVLRADLQGPCQSPPSDTGRVPLLQISLRDARRLFGCAPIAEEEKAYAVEKRFATPEAFGDPQCR